MLTDAEENLRIQLCKIKEILIELKEKSDFIQTNNFSLDSKVSRIKDRIESLDEYLNDCVIDLI